MPVDSSRLKVLFIAAVELPAAERATFLDRECGADADLRQRVEALLKAHDAPGSFLADQVDLPVDTQEEISPTPGTVAYLSSHAAGTVIADRYTLVEKVGEGGMGEVWVAKQSEPVKRKVGLKLIKTGMDSKAVLTRFEQERQALGLMDHPNIAHVLDGGLTPTGQPFFVMELVNGLPLTKFCDEMKLTPRERMELFIPICQAVQHAHQKGIIHRDLKPSNILVTVIDGKGVPKIIDFGVAKATAGRLTEESLSTQFGAVIGTLEYMAPEQAGFTGQDVDTRADVYSLGVILYELLTGLRPHDGKQLRLAAYAEILRILHEDEPSKPSTRLSTDASLPSLAALRRTDPKKLMAMLRGELDWVVMKCLDKDRNRRYETASGLARDIQRYLAEEAVEARPPSVGYRTRKFLSRNKGPVAAAVVVLLTLIGGIIGTAIGLVRAVSAEGIAQQRFENAEAARSAADALAKAEAEQRKRAEQAEAETLADYIASTNEVIEQLIGSKPTLGPQEKTYLEKTLKRWQAFAQRKGDDEQSQSIRAEAHHRIAFLWQRLGRVEEARSEWELARDLHKALIARNPGVSAYHGNLALACANLGTMYNFAGQREEACALYRQAIEILKPLAKQPSAKTEFLISLAGCCGNLAALLTDLGQPHDARKEHELALAIRKKLAERFPNDPSYKQMLALSHAGLGYLLNTIQKQTEARLEYERAHELLQALVERYPDNPQYQLELARTQNNSGNLLCDFRQPEDAVKYYERARIIQAKLAKEYPSMPIYKQELARTHPNLGNLLKKLAQYEAAEAEYERARNVQEKLTKEFPGRLDYRHELAATYVNYGSLLFDLRKFSKSLSWSDEAIKILAANHHKEPKDVNAKDALKVACTIRANALDRLHKHAEAVKEWERVLGLSPDAERVRARLNRANSRIQTGEVAGALVEVADLTEASELQPVDWYNLGCVYAVASGTVADKKQEYADRAMVLLRKAVQAGYDNPAHMAKDSDLDSLRGREDFQKIMAELEAAAKTPKKP
jgi:tetratricopeptide (TPR) repeat protein